MPTLKVAGRSLAGPTALASACCRTLQMYLGEEGYEYIMIIMNWPVVLDTDRIVCNAVRTDRHSGNAL